MFQRFGNQASLAVALAVAQVIRLGEEYVDTEHLLLGILHVGPCAARALLAALGIEIQDVQDAIKRQTASTGGNPDQNPQLTPRAGKAIELAHKQRLALGDNQVGTEHLLLGLIEEDDGLAARTLKPLGATLEATLQELRRMRDEPTGQEGASDNPSGDTRCRLVIGYARVKGFAPRSAYEAFALTVDELDPALHEALASEKGVPFGELPDELQRALISLESTFETSQPTISPTSVIRLKRSQGQSVRSIGYAIGVSLIRVMLIKEPPTTSESAEDSTTQAEALENPSP